MGWQLALESRGPSRERWLQRALDEAPGSVRLSALRGLVHDGRVQAMLERLIERAKGEGELAAVALEAVLPLPDPRVSALMMDRFAHGDAATRDRAARYLREAAARDPKTTRTRLLALLGEGDDGTRRLSIEILLETGKSDEVLLDILEYSKEI